MGISGTGALINVIASDAPQWQKTYGKYVCDGVADDVQIQAALDEAATTGNGVVLSGGNFALAAGITIASNVVFSGSGIKSTTLTWAEGSYHRVQNSDTTNGNSFITIEKMTMLFGGIAASADFHGIRFQNVTDFWMDTVELSSAPHHNLVSIDGGSDTNARWYISNCVSHDAGQRTATDGDGFRPSDGFTIGTPDDGAVLTNCRAYSNSHHGFHIGSGCIVNACLSYSNNENNLYMAGDEAQCIGGIYRLPTASHNILVENCENGVISGAYVFDSGSTSADTIRINSGGNAGFRVIGCTIQDSGRTLVRAQGSDHILIQGNVIDGGTSGTRGIHIIDADHVAVVGNQIRNCSTSPGNGVQIEIVSGTIDQTLIQGNQIYANATGVNIENDASVTDVFIDGNMFDANTSANLTDAGGKATIGSDFSGLTSKYALA